MCVCVRFDHTETYQSGGLSALNLFLYAYMYMSLDDNHLHCCQDSSLQLAYNGFLLCSASQAKLQHLVDGMSDTPRVRVYWEREWHILNCCGYS